MLHLPWFEHHPRPLVIAHRGASLDAPENTMAAFLLALEQGAHAVELDVALCASGDLVVIHDATVDRTTTGCGKVVDLPLKDIKSLDAGGAFDPRYRGEPVPTLNEVFETVGRKCLINVELKNYSTPFDNLAVKVAQLVIRHNLQARVFFSSFNPFNFRKIKKLLPDSPVGLLTMKGMAGAAMLQLTRLGGSYDALHPHYTDFDVKAVRHRHAAGMPLFPYTVNDPADMLALSDAGVDGLITDVPALAVKVLGGKQAARDLQ